MSIVVINSFNTSSELKHCVVVMFVTVSTMLLIDAMVHR